MLIPFETIKTLPQETVNNLIYEYLLTKVDDINFESLDSNAIDAAINQCKKALESGLLMVEYGEEDESISIRHTDEITKSSF